MKTALVHYWLATFRGGERVLEALCRLFPEADIFTHVFVPENMPESITGRRVSTSFINCLPKAAKWYRHYLPLMPMALEKLDLRGYDLVISSESGPAKGVITDPGSLHLCYCHTPMRYLWDMSHDYMASAGKLKSFVYTPFLHYMRLWDVSCASRVDAFAANSRFTAQRINKFYRREASVIYPPVNAAEFKSEQKREDFYLLAGELVPYKRADIAIDACVKAKKKLVVIGGGPGLRKLSKNAPDNITFLGRREFPVVRDYLSRCRALLFPGLEDFGIVPVEAMAAGAPVIAYARGGALETIIDGVTGLFFQKQTPEALIMAINEFEGLTFYEDNLLKRAKEFSIERFNAGIRGFVAENSRQS